MSEKTSHKNLSKKIKQIFNSNFSFQLTNTMKKLPFKETPTYKITKKTTNKKDNTRSKITKKVVLDYFFTNKIDLYRITFGKVCENYILDSDHKKVTIEVKINELFLNTPAINPNYTPKIKTKQTTLKKLTKTIEDITNSNLKLSENTNKLKNMELDITEVDFLLTEATDVVANTLEITLGVTKCPAKRGTNKIIHSKDLKSFRNKKNDLIKLKKNINTAIFKIESNSFYTNFFILKKNIKKHFPDTTDLSYPESLDKLKALINKISPKIKILTKKTNKIISTFKKENINRAIANLTKEGDKGSKTFFNRVRGNFKNNDEILFLEKTDKDGNIEFIDSNIQMIEHTRNSWQEIFQSKGEMPWEDPSTLIFKQHPTTNKNNDPITSAEIEEAIQKSKSFRTPGKSRLGAEIYKHSQGNLNNLLLNVYNQLWRLESIPYSWREAPMLLISKSEDTTNILNYRPISILLTEYKIYTEILRSRLLKEIEDKEILMDNQFGFRKHRTTGMAHRLYHNIIQYSINKNRDLFSLYIDFKKAFDSVEHWAIGKMLDDYGISEKLKNNIQALYFSLRAEIKMPFGKTVINLNRGVRQGDGLSTLLYILFINQLILNIENKELGILIKNDSKQINIASIAFVDDLKIITDKSENMITLFQVTKDFCTYFKIEINVIKTKVASRHNKQVKLTWKGVEIENIGEEGLYKDLGILTNLKLNFKKQRDNIEKITIFNLCRLRKLKITTKQHIDVINKMIIPVITYTTSAVPFTDKYMTKLENKICNSVRNKVRVIPNSIKERFYLRETQGGWNLKNVSAETNKCIIPHTLNKLLNGVSHITCFTTELLLQQNNNRIDYYNHAQFNGIKKLQIPNSFPTHILKIFLKENLSIVNTENNNTKIKHIFNLNATHRDLTIIKDEIWIATDGSFKDGIANSAICFKPNSRINSGWRTCFNQTIFLAELQPIKIILHNFTNNNVRIFIDSTSVIKKLQELPEWNPNTEIDKNSIPPLRYLKTLLEKRKLLNLRTTFEWIPSHLEDGYTTPLKEKRWAEIKNTYGIRLANLIQEMNQIADHLAENINMEHYISKTDGVHPYSNKWITQNCLSKEYLNENNRTIIETNKQTQYWKKNIGASKKKGDYEEILWPQSNILLNKKDFKLNSIQSFIFRNRRGNLSLNEKLNNIQQFYINRPIKTFNQARFRELHHTNKCEVCLIDPESFEHFAGKCNKNTEFENTLIQETDIIIYETLIESDKNKNKDKTQQHMNQPSTNIPCKKRKRPQIMRKKRKRATIKTHSKDKRVKRLSLLRKHFFETNQRLIETPIWYLNNRTNNKYSYRGSQGYITKDMVKQIQEKALTTEKLAIKMAIKLNNMYLHNLYNKYLSRNKITWEHKRNIGIDLKKWRTIQQFDKEVT